ncbi:MAG: hypothetical protein BWY31_04791 [Lentisphaerae bacterium ADurb.Bin242]|nr:MAG: hypothetical protein BWY31_04791 [Lentisphaerae bacterium ADurb.Bin242]
MAVFHLCNNGPHHVVERKCSAFLRHDGMENNVHEDIPQFFPEILIVFGVDGIQQFAAFLQEEGHQGTVGLFAVPGTALGGTQFPHDIDQFLHRFGRHVAAFFELFGL